MIYLKNIQKKQKNLNKEFKNNISIPNRILSPSDFGLHNTISKKNKLYFFDFEYFGWDDPIKLICDFFGILGII